jgi:hypothetical protein
VKILKKKITIFYIFILKKYNKLINIKNTKFINLVLLHKLDVNNEIIDEEKKYFIFILVKNNANNLFELLLSYKNINLEKK